MIFNSIRSIYKNQKGFTFIELILAVAITGIITGGITMAITQLLIGNARTSNHMVAIRQVQNAGYWNDGFVNSPEGTWDTCGVPWMIKDTIPYEYLLPWIPPDLACLGSAL